MASLLDLLKSLGRGISVPIRTRVGGGLGDPVDRAGAAARSQSQSRAIFLPGAEPPVNLDGFDMSRMIPFVSSNVDGGYFNYYYTADGSKLDVGDMFLLFQKRRPEVPGGRPIGPQRAYIYQSCPEYVWDAIFEAGSKGGAVHDVVIKGGVPGDPL